jgi:hypothetical protein
MKNKHKHRDGYYLDPEIADGDSVKVPALLMDGRPKKGWVSPLSDREVKLLDQHRCGYRTADQLSDHQRRAGAEIAAAGVMGARDAWIEQMTDAWRGVSGAKLDARRKPPPDDDDDDDEEDERAGDSRSLADIRRPAIESRARWVRGLQDAWKTPAPIAAPSPKLTHGLPTSSHGRPIRDVTAAGPGKAATLPPNEADDPQARRDAAWAEYSNSLSQAWKNPGPGPGLPGASASWRGPGA